MPRSRIGSSPTTSSRATRSCSTRTRRTSPRATTRRSLARVGLAVRLFGDDVRWYNPGYKAPIPNVSEMPEGQPVDGEWFPVLWRRRVSAAA
ncbi:MAG: hypothetical protein U1F11_11425 [Steroidobacteraceae bacterium]